MQGKRTRFYGPDEEVNLPPLTFTEGNSCEEGFKVAMRLIYVQFKEEKKKLCFPWSRDNLLH